MRRTAGTVFCASLLLTTSAFASGYGLREFSGSALGVSYAGAAANGLHGTTMAFNPALVNDVGDFDISASGIGILPNTAGTFTATTAVGSPVAGETNPHGIVNTALVPTLALRYRLSDQFTVGLLTSSPWGMVTDYGDTFVGRYYATMSDVKTYNATPIVGWQPAPEFSIGAGVQVQYTTGRLGKAIDFGSIGAIYHIPGSVPDAMDGSVLLKAHSWAYGFVLGVEWKPTSDLSIGLSYRSKIDNTLKGTENFTLDPYGLGAYLSAHTGAFVNSPASAGFTNPQVVTFGLRWHVDDQFTLLAGGDWTGWSAFKTLTAQSANPYQPDDVSVMNWKSSLFGSVGVEYTPCHDWVLRLGTAYDETPTVDEFRTPGIPDGNRVWISGGVGYRWNEHVDLDVSVARLFAQRADINLLATDPGNALRGSLHGSVDMGVTLVGFELTYH
jgi:long-chain fatty acid transport protein